MGGFRECEFEADDLFCCDCSLKTGVTILAAILVILSSIGCLMLGLLFIPLSDIKQNDENTDLNEALLIVVAVLFTLSALVLVTSIFLAYGAVKANCVILEIWSVYMIVVAVLDFVGIVGAGIVCVHYNVFGLVGGLGIFLLVAFFTEVYCVVLVRSLIKHIRDPPTEFIPPEHNMVPGNMQPGYMQPGNMQPGNMQPGYMQYGYMQPGYTPYANMQPQPENMQPLVTNTELLQTEKASP